MINYCHTYYRNSDDRIKLKVLHDVYTIDGETSTIERFYEENGYSIPSDREWDAIREKDRRIQEIGDELSYASSDSDYDKIIKEIAPREKAYVALVMMIREYIKEKEWSKALSIISLYKPYWGKNSKRVDDLIKTLEADYDASVKTWSIAAVNKGDGSEYTPIISANGMWLYFCGRDRNDNYSGEDIFVSRRSAKTGWGTPKL